MKLSERIDSDLDQSINISTDCEAEYEKYEFIWPGKKASYKLAQIPTTKKMESVISESLFWEQTNNLYIEGDNLDGLKLLRNQYANSVKMIYIDPPYNTGSDFIYSDNFTHAQWCSLMYERLLVARDLLKDDGAIFISIDDNEVCNLKNICNEVFGEANFIGQWNWFKSATPSNLSKKIKKNIEYILCYEKKRSSIRYKGTKKVSHSSNGLLNQTNKFATLTFPAMVVEAGLSDGLYKAGKYGTQNYEINLLNDVRVKDGLFIDEFQLQSKFKWGQQNLLKEIEKGTKISIRTTTFSPSYERTDYEPEVPPNLIDKSVGVDTTEQAGKQLAELFDQVKIFDYPKPVDLILYLMNFLCDEEDIILDFFAGSSTTGHAVMEYNASTGGNRKFILIQIPEKIAEDTAAYKAGYRDLCEVGKERLRRAAKKLAKEYPDAKVDLGFKVYKLK